MQTRDVVVIGLVVVFGLILVALLGGGMMGPGPMGYWGGFDGMMGWGGGWGIVMLLFWVLVIAGVIALVMWLLRGGVPAASSGAAGPQNRALDILKERYARGEITRDEYEAMLRDLREP